MAASMRKHLSDGGLLAGVVLPAAIEQLLEGLEIEALQLDGTGTVTAGLTATPLFLDLQLRPPGPSTPFLLQTGAPDAAFRLWLQLAEVAPARHVLDLAAAAPDLLFTPATANVTTDAAVLEPAEGAVAIAGATLALLIEGTRPLAAMRLVPTVGAPEGVVQLFLTRVPAAGDAGAAAPTAVLIRNTGFGFEAPDGLIVDQSATSAGMIASGVVTRAGDPEWQGLSIPRLLFYLPSGVPIFGDCRVEGRLDIASSPSSGIEMTLTGNVPPRNGWPELTVRIECIDPAATGLSAFAPTLVEIALELPVDGHQEPVAGHGMLTVAAGKPLVARARFSRDPTAADGKTLLSIAIEAQGAQGLILVDAAKGMPAKLLVAAGAFATAIVADEGPPSNADGSGVAIHALLLAALGASAFLQDKGKLVLHGAELVTEGRGLPIGGAMRFRLDYSVDVMVRPIGVGGLSVAMKDEQPMRVRLREVVLAIDPAASGLDKFSLDFGQADMEVEDPGGWQVKGPESLFDILGTRSGRGSLWFEVDLAFRLDLGPLRVSGATLRATLVDGHPVVSVRGLEAALLIPALLDAKGGFQVRDTGFSASLGARLIPLGADGLATLDVERGDGTTMVLINLDLDLPGPLPLAATGLALFGVGGTFGIFARPRTAAENEDPVAFLLNWKPDRSGFEPAPGAMSIGVRVAVGTAADMGFTFGAVGGVVVTVPDFALRGSLSAKMLSGRPRLVPSDQPIVPEKGLNVVGAFLIDPAHEVTFGLTGSYTLAPLLRATIPVGGHFPVPDPLSWYVNIGADGYPSPDRRSGPAKLSILPGSPLEKTVRGYLMVRGAGLAPFPYTPSRPFEIGSVYHGFVVAFGFSLEWNVGLKPVLWAEVHGGFDVLIAARPLVVAGRGWIGGSIHVGPLSVSVEATLHFILAPGHGAYVEAKICGEIDLWLTTVRKCIRFGIGDKPVVALPWPTTHPLDRLEGEAVTGDGAVLVDDAYRTIAMLSRSPDDAPLAWADAIVLLQFAVAPSAAAVAAPQFDGIARPDQAAPTGSDRLQYWWTLRGVTLSRIEPDGAEVPEGGPLHAGWQRGRFGDTTAAHEAAELALLTRDRQLFTQRMPDGGRSLPVDPIAQQGSICGTRAVAQPGWAIGAPAREIETAWHLPPDVVSPDRSRSRVKADIAIPTLTLREKERDIQIPLHPFGVAQMASGIEIVPAGPQPFNSGAATAPEFKGAFWFDGGRRPGGSRGTPNLSAAIRASDLLHDGAVWLVTELEPIQARRYLRVAFDGATEAQDVDKVVALPILDGERARCAVLFQARAPFATARIQYPGDARTGIMGVGGITQATIDWVASHNAVLDQEAAALAAVAAAGPQADPLAAAGMRSILKPGSLYRINVDMSWGARMQKPEGGTTDVDNQLNYGDPDHPVPGTRSYYFRTHPVPPPAPAPPTNTVAIFDSRWRFMPPRDPFNPALIERHLLGYTPAQAEAAWFCDDPLEAHFGVGHVTALATAYGYAMQVAVRRVDVPGAAGEPIWLAGVLRPLQQVGLLRTGASQYLVETAKASPCALPTPGATISVAPPLIERAWYEVHLALTSATIGVPDTKLAGVTFRTSLYRDVASMMQAVHFGFDVAGTHNGDVALDVDPSGLTPGTVLGDDLAFEDLLAQLGLAGWPRPIGPRTSLLWHRSSDGRWTCAGVLVEGVEPLHRADRCEIGDLHLAMAATPVVFDVVRRDRSGSRLLYLTRTPFVPQRSRSLADRPWPLQPFERGKKISKRLLHDPRLQLSVTDSRHDPVTRVGTLVLPLVPSFAGEAA